MADFNNLIAARLNLEFDFERINSEILSLRPLWEESPITKYWLNKALAGAVFMSEEEELYNNITYRYRSGEIIKKEIKEFPAFYNLYLKSHGAEENFKLRNFGVTKYLDHKEWIWRETIRDKIPYTISSIETLPYKTIGLVRTLITEKTFLPTHIDCEEYNLIDDIGKTLGISIISDTGNVPLRIWSKKDNCVKEVWGNCLIFKDSEAHAVPYTNGRRITIRIFGDIDLEKLAPLIDEKTILL